MRPPLVTGSGERFSSALFSSQTPGWPRKRQPSLSRLPPYAGSLNSPSCRCDRKQLEERCLVGQDPARDLSPFQISEQRILLRCRGARESHAEPGLADAVEQRQAVAIDREVLAIRARQRPVQVGDDADLARAGASGRRPGTSARTRPRGQCLAGAQGKQRLRLGQLALPAHPVHRSDSCHRRIVTRRSNCHVNSPATSSQSGPSLRFTHRKGHRQRSDAVRAGSRRFAFSANRRVEAAHGSFVEVLVVHRNLLFAALPPQWSPFPPAAASSHPGHRANPRSRALRSRWRRAVP